MVTGPTGNINPIGVSATPLKEKYMQVKLYTMKGCTNCQLVKDHLEREGIVFQTVDCDENMDEVTIAAKAVGGDVLPIICYDGDNYISGYNKENVKKLIKLCKS